MKNIHIILLMTAIGLFSCSGRQVIPTFSVSEKNTINRNLQYITDSNNAAPETLSAEITIIGTLNNKKYSATGSLVFNRATDSMNIVLYDFIFKSPISTFIKKGDDISVYSPIDNQLVLTSMKSLNTKMILDIHLSSDMLIALIQGKVPLLEDHFVKNIYQEEKSSKVYLILENKKSYETISLHKNRPDRLLFVDKKKKKKIEVYIKKKTYTRGIRYFKLLHIKSESDKTDLEISFSKVRVNKPVKIKSEDDISIPRGTKVLQLR